MRTITGWTIAALGALTACGSGDDGDGGSNGQGPPTTITLTSSSTTPPDIVAFRNDADPTWQTATLVSPGHYTAVVTGPYWISVACHYAPTPDQRANVIRQYGRSLSDPTELDVTACLADTASPPRPSLLITGTLARKGKVELGSTPASFLSDTEFEVPIDPGTYTLYAASADHYLAQRDLAVTANAALPPIDIDASGVAMTTTAFTITNPAKATGLMPQAAVLVQDYAKFGDGSGLYVYRGDPATAQIVPSSALTADEVQTVSIREITTVPNRQSGRAFRQPFKVGDSTKFTLPDPLDDLTWQIDQNQFSAHWKALPKDIPFSFGISGQAASHDASSGYLIDVSASFFSVTDADHVAAELDLPGYDATRAVDPDAGYDTDISGQRADDPSIHPVISVWDYQTVAPKL